MNTKFERNYWVLKTKSADAIGLLTTINPIGDVATFEFSLHCPQHTGSMDEFMGLNGTSIDFAEFETHRDAFKTLEELEVVGTWLTVSGTTRSTLVRKTKNGRTTTTDSTPDPS